MYTFVSEFKDCCTFPLQVDGCKVYPGEDTVPVLLNITYALSQDQETAEIQKIFRKDTTVGEMKVKV